KVVDIENYYADVTVATEEHPPEWKLLYSAKEEYNLTDLSPNSWNNLVKKIFEDEETATKNAFRVSEPLCDDICRSEILCSLRSGHHNMSLYCPENYALPPPSDFEFRGNSHA
ncbi:hypothetical protein OESDEN_12924, partial [Oesophagostomum dentatum]